jgi:hypothetical protein
MVRIPVAIARGKMRAVTRLSYENDAARIDQARRNGALQQ